MSEPRHRYSGVSLALHWVTAVLVVVQIGLIMAGDNIEGPLAGTLRDLHKSVGLSILVLTLVRIGWRLGNPALPSPPGTSTWERWAAKITHVLFYVVLLALPLTGWLASSAAGRDIAWFGLFEWPLLPIGGGRETASALMDGHRLAVKLLYILLVLHIGAALKHHFIDRDNVLHRMIPLIRRRP